MINETFHLRDIGISNGADCLELPRHRWFSFKEAFSPVLVEAAILDAGCTSGDLVIDPFAGSGTVSITAAENDLDSMGYEVNPFLAFLAKTKCNQISGDKLREDAFKVIPAMTTRKRSKFEGFSTFSNDGNCSKYLFNTPVLRAFDAAWNSLELVRPACKALVRLALLSAAVRSANAFKDGKCLRYYHDWRERKYDRNHFVDAYMDEISKFADDLKSSIFDHSRVSVFNVDSRDGLHKIQRPFQLCITSPPYLNSFDYTDVYRVELFLGRFIKSMEELRSLRKRTIRSHVQTGLGKVTGDARSQLLGECLNRIDERIEYLWDKRIPSMIQAYFDDIAVVLTALRSSADRDAKMWIVVATSAYAGVEIPVDLIIADIASKAGWMLNEIGVLRNLRTAGQNWARWQSEKEFKPRLRESVVILSAGSGRLG